MVIFKIKHHHKTLYNYAYVHSLELSGSYAQFSKSFQFD